MCLGLCKPARVFVVRECVFDPPGAHESPGGHKWWHNVCLCICECMHVFVVRYCMFDPHGARESPGGHEWWHDLCVCLHECVFVCTFLREIVYVDTMLLMGAQEAVVYACILMGPCRLRHFFYASLFDFTR